MYTRLRFTVYNAMNAILLNVETPYDSLLLCPDLDNIECNLGCRVDIWIVVMPYPSSQLGTV